MSRNVTVLYDWILLMLCDELCDLLWGGLY